jgi:MFS family permease
LEIPDGNLRAIQAKWGALSDRLGRKWMIAAGMWVQALGIWVIVAGKSMGAWLGGAALLGLGTALVYPTLLATISDVAHPEWRASSVGVYRLWRDGGYAVGALLAGLLADSLGLAVAIAAIGGLTFLSGVVVAGVMYETLPAPGKTPFRRGVGHPQWPGWVQQSRIRGRILLKMNNQAYPSNCPQSLLLVYKSIISRD